MEVLTKQEFFEFIIFNCMLPFIISFVVSCILNADMCLEIVGEIVYWFNKRVIEPVRFWIWKKTHKDEVEAALESWARAIESTGKMYREGIESWAESIAHAHSEREE